MKLRSIAESLMMAKLRDAIASNGLNHQVIRINDAPIEASSGHDAYEAPLTPKKARRSPRLGLERRPGAIRL